MSYLDTHHDIRTEDFRSLFGESYRHFQIAMRNLSESQVSASIASKKLLKESTSLDIR